MLQRAIILLYDGVVQRLAFKAIQRRVAQLGPFCPSVEPDGASPNQSPGRLVWVPWPFHAAGSRDVAEPGYLSVPGLCRHSAVMPRLLGAVVKGMGHQGRFGHHHRCEAWGSAPPRLMWGHRVSCRGSPPVLGWPPQAGLAFSCSSSASARRVLSLSLQDSRHAGHPQTSPAAAAAACPMGCKSTGQPR